MKFTPLILAFITALLFSTHPLKLLAQQKIEEPTVGISFTVSADWQANKTEAGYVLGSNTIAGLIILLPNTFSTKNELIQEAQAGIQDDEGTNLRLKGSVTDFNAQGVAGYYTGTMQLENVEAYMIGLINTKGGKGATCIVVTTPEMFSELHVSELQKIANSIVFSNVVMPAIVEEWNKGLKQPGGCRLKHLTSSSDTDYSGGYTGSSDQAIIDLCPRGFSYYSSSSSTFDSGSGFGSSNGSNEGQGTWEIDYNGTHAVLVLYFNDGREFNYELTYEDNKTYLNGTRYFLLFDSQGPGCY